MDDIFKGDGAISEFKKDYKERPSQIEAAKLIDEGINKNKITIIEGETGMGKSFAYLFPTAKAIAESNFKKKAVIATSGISLQEQLFNKDIPFVSKVMKTIYPSWNDDFKVTLLKGKQNFLCMKKVLKLGLDQDNN